MTAVVHIVFFLLYSKTNFRAFRYQQHFDNKTNASAMHFGKLEKETLTFTIFPFILFFYFFHLIEENILQSRNSEC